MLQYRGGEVLVWWRSGKYPKKSIMTAVAFLVPLAPFANAILGGGKRKSTHNESVYRKVRHEQEKLSYRARRRIGKLGRRTSSILCRAVFRYRRLSAQSELHPKRKHKGAAGAPRREMG